MIALYPGSFDPITYGHVDVATRAAQMFDTLVIAPVQTNAKSSKLFSTEERIAMIEESLAEVPNIRVQSFTGLTVDFARAIGAAVLIRGLRLVTDFEYELQLAQNNAVLNPAIETCCIITSHQVGFISSSQVKEIALNGGDVSRLVPAPVLSRLDQRYKSGSN